MKIPGLRNSPRETQFIVGVAKLVSGKAAAALIGLTLTPFIARLFLPEDFGVFAIVVALIQPLAVLGTLRLDIALVMPDTRQKTIELFAAASNWLFFFALSLLFIAGIVAAAGLPLPFEQRIGVWIWVVPFAVLVQGLCLICNGWLTRDEQFGVMATSEMSRAATTPATRLVIGLVSGTSVWGLASGYFAGLLVQLVQLWRRLPVEVPAALLPGKWSTHLKTIALWKDFPLFSAPRGLLLAATQSVPIIAMGVIYTPAVAGFYAMAVRLIGSPGNLIATAVRRVFMQRIAELVNEGRSLRTAWLKTTLTLLMLGVIPFLLLWQFGQELLTLLLGPRWTQAGAYAELIAILLFTQWIMVPSNGAIVVMRRQAFLLFIEVLVTIGLISALLVAHQRQIEPLTTVAALVGIRATADLLTFLTGMVLVWRRPAAA